jgi:intracellular septation protein A
MRRQKIYVRITLLISILFGILLPLTLGVKDPVYIAISFTLVWAIYSLILLGYVFLVEDRYRKNKSQKIKEEDPFPPSLIQEWEAFWKITVKKYKDSRTDCPEWN